MARYKSAGNWSVSASDTLVVDGVTVTVATEVSDVVDSANGQVYPQGAFRVLLDGRPVSGKGGSTPFFGESAWCSAERRHDDLVTAHRFRRAA